jgi:hypothetical protein
MGFGIPGKGAAFQGALVAAALLALAVLVPAAPNKRIVSKRADIMACSDAIQTAGAALTVQAPLLRYTITAFNPNWFDPHASRQGPPLFTLRISPQLMPYADRLTLRVHVSADTALGGSGGSFASVLQVFDRTTEPLGASRVGVPLTSGEVFGLDFQAGTGTDFRGSDLYAQVAEKREVPPMNLRLEFSLFCSGAPVAENGVNVAFGPTAKVRTVRTVRALSPGADVAASRAPSVFTLFPLFRISSELYDAKTFEYAPEESRLEVFVYEVDEGQSPQDAFRGLEFARFPADRFPAIYPADQPGLVPGRVYAWRARALLRGPESRYSYSNGLQFRVDPALANAAGEAPPAALSEPPVLPGQVRYGETYSRRVLAALKIILGPGYDAVLGARRDQVPAQGLIRLNGRPYSLEELEALARQFAGGSQRVTRIRFE